MNPISCHINVFSPGPGAPGFESGLDAIAAAGCDLVGMPPLEDAVDAAALRQALEAAGLGAVLFATQRPDADVSSADAGIRDAGMARLDRALELAAELGATHVTGAPYAAYGLASEWTPDSRARSAEAVAAWAGRAARAGLAVSFEVLNRYESAALNTASQAREFLAMCGDPGNLGIHLDSFHMAIEEEDPIAQVTATVPGLGLLELGQSGRGRLARGAAPIADIVGAAVRGGYRGIIGFEAFSRAILPAATADRIKIWREPFDDPEAVVREAVALIRRAQSSALHEGAAA